MVKNRESNLELYRIIVMLMIVAHHYVVNSGLIGVVDLVPTSLKSIYLYLFGAWGKIGINCFVLITGFYMCKSHITIRKFVMLVLQVIFYNVVVYMAFVICGYKNFDIKEAITLFLPVKNIVDGFTSCFIVFYLFIPFLSILVNNLTKKQHLALIVLCLSVFTLWAMLPWYSVRSNYVVWFSVLFFIGSYLRMYNVGEYISSKKWARGLLLSIVLSSLSVVCLIFLGKNDNAYYFVADSNAILAVVTSLSAFMFFKSLKIKYSKVINVIGASTFGVLLIHANSGTMRIWLWRDLLDNIGWYDKNIYLHSIVSVLLVFTICSILEIIRKKYIEKPMFVYLDKFFEEKKCVKYWN